MNTPLNKKTDKKQRRSSSSEDLENSETPKKTKVRKELLDDVESTLEISSNASPRKKLTDIANNSRVTDVPKRRSVNFMLEDPKPGCSKDLDLDDFKHESGAPKVLTLHDTSRPEPVKKRWLREACRESVQWADDFGYPIVWEEDMLDTYEDKSLTDSKPACLTDISHCSVPNGRVTPKFADYSSSKSYQDNSILNNEFCRKSTPVALDRFRSKFSPPGAPLSYRNPRSPLSSPGESSSDGSYKLADESLYYGGQTENRILKSTDKSDSEYYKLNEARPTVLMHSSRLYNDKKRSRTEDCPYDDPLDSNSSPDSQRACKIQKLNDDEDFCTALVLMQLANHNTKPQIKTEMK